MDASVVLASKLDDVWQFEHVDWTLGEIPEAGRKRKAKEWDVKDAAEEGAIAATW